MPIVYFDSSAFVKLVVQERGSETAATLWDGCDAPVASRLAYPEVCAALAAAGRAHRLDPPELQSALAAWEEFWAAVRPVEFTDQISKRAGRLAERHALRGADAIHLASAMALSTENLLFAVWDRRLRSGVTTAGIRLVPDQIA